MDYRDRARLGLFGPVAIRFPSIINPQSGDRASEEIALAIGNSRIGLGLGLSYWYCIAWAISSLALSPI